MQQRSAPRRGHGLFAEDFDDATGVIVLDDAPDPPAEPEPPAPPPITRADLEAARAEGLAEGLRQGRAQAASEAAAQLQSLIGTMVEQMRAADQELRRCVEENAEQVTQVLFAMLGATFPTLCQRFGAAEVARFTREVVAVLDDEPRIVVRAHPSMLPEIERALASLEPEHRENITIEGRETVPPGDARITWRNAVARRDAQARWAELSETMAQLGLGSLAPAAELRVVSAA